MAQVHGSHRAWPGIIRACQTNKTWDWGDFYLFGESRICWDTQERRWRGRGWFVRSDSAFIFSTPKQYSIISVQERH